MKINLFCYECGEFEYEKNLDGFSTNGIDCNFCGTKNRFKDSYYPHFSVNEFIQTINEMDEQNKNNISQTIKTSYETFNTFNSSEINVTLQKYEEIYYLMDKLLENEKIYSIDAKSKVIDDLEEKLIKLYPTDTAIGIVSSLPFVKTHYRKPILILIASTIELLFNTYFEEVCKIEELPKKLTTSIPKKIEYLDSNRAKSLQNHMNNYDENFYFLWEQLRSKRNKIIHKNSLYISNKMIEDNMQLLKSSVFVFINLTSELYREIYIKPTK
ncbi:hypothetical protein [Lysinibacillus capsici]|uniref:hypothetical protein n=1 Tax=Lysinibacillus capsici TaxID=2115968 RepID=UPI0034E57004